MIYRHDHHGRRWTVIVLILIIWICILLTSLVFNLVWGIMAILLAFTLPTLWDVILDTHSWVKVWQKQIVWASALRSGNRSDINHVRIYHQLDGSMKITLIHVSGEHTRLPPDIAPPVDIFQAALKETGITTERYPFSLF
jgi:hypothetical protein